MKAANLNPNNLSQALRQMTICAAAAGILTLGSGCQGQAADQNAATPEILYMAPGSGDVVNANISFIIVRMSGEMEGPINPDIITVRDSGNNPLPGYCDFVEQHIVFYPDVTLAPGELYTVTLDLSDVPASVSMNGFPIEWSFSTAP